MSQASESTLELDSPQNLRLLQREAWAELLGWLAMVAVLLAGLIGLLGPGPLSSRAASSPDGQLRVNYHAIARCEAPAELTLLVGDRASAGDRIEIAISRSWTNHVTLETVVPQPLEQRLAEDEVVYVFPTAAAANQPAGSIVFRYKHDSYGTLAFNVRVANNRPVKIRQLVLP